MIENWCMEIKCIQGFDDTAWFNMQVWSSIIKFRDTGTGKKNGSGPSFFHLLEKKTGPFNNVKVQRIMVLDLVCFFFSSKQSLLSARQHYLRSIVIGWGPSLSLFPYDFFFSTLLPWKLQLLRLTSLSALPPSSLLGEPRVDSVYTLPG